MSGTRWRSASPAASPRRCSRGARSARRARSSCRGRCRTSRRTGSARTSTSALGLGDPVLARDPQVEQPVLHVDRDLLRAQDASRARCGRRRSCRGSRGWSRGARCRSAASNSRSVCSSREPFGMTSFSMGRVYGSGPSLRKKQLRSPVWQAAPSWCTRGEEHVGVAVDAELVPVLDVAAGVALAPELPPRAAPIDHAALVERALERLAVRPRRTSARRRSRRPARSPGSGRARRTRRDASSVDAPRSQPHREPSAARCSLTSRIVSSPKWKRAGREHRVGAAFGEAPRRSARGRRRRRWRSRAPARRHATARSSSRS